METASTSDQPNSSPIPVNHSYAHDTSVERISTNAVPSTSRGLVTPEQDSLTKERISDLLSREISNEFFKSNNLYCLDQKLIPKTIMKKYDTRKMSEEFKAIYYWIKPNLSSSEHVRSMLNGSCYVVRYRYPSSITAAEKLVAEVFDEKLRTSANRENVAAMLIIPIPIPGPKRALVYCTGRAQSLMNKHAIIKQWGLKLAASEYITSKGKSIKELTTLSQHNDKKKERTTKTSSLEDIAVFAPEAGAELFYRMRLKSDGGIIVEGSTNFKFLLSISSNKNNNEENPGDNRRGMQSSGSHPIKQRKIQFDTVQTQTRELDGGSDSDTEHSDGGSDSDTEDSDSKSGVGSDVESDIKTLVDISLELYNIYVKDEIHPEYEPFIRKEVDAELRKELNEALVEILSNKSTVRDHYEDYFFDLNRDVLEWGYEKRFSHFDDGSLRRKLLDALFNTFRESDADLDTLVKLNCGKEIEEPVCALLVVDAFEHKENLYNYNTGKWFQVPVCRFPNIRKEIACNEIGYEKLGLICYTEEHETYRRMNKKGGFTTPKEFNYNADAANKLSTGYIPSIKGILCDRVNIKYDDKFTFEFADIFTINDGASELGKSKCIIHVKRRGANALEKHCIQLVRTKEYLHSVLGRKKYFDVLLQGCVNTLYTRQGLDPVEERVMPEDNVRPARRTGKYDHLTHGVVSYLYPKTKNDWTRIFKAITNKNLTRSFIEHVIVSLNALCYCAKQGKPLTLDDATIFCDLVQYFHGVATDLFSGKPTSQKKMQEMNLYFVLAIINDTKNTIKSECETTYVDDFTNQELLTLEILKRSVESAGFKFKWTVIEKNFLKATKEKSEEE